MVRAAIFYASIVAIEVGCTREQDVAAIPPAPDAPTDAGVDTTLPSFCPDFPDAGAMVNVGAFCIDATEVTRAQYATFLASTPPKPRAECAWSTDHTPKVSTDPGIDCPPFDFTTSPDLPMVCIDWCDADAYCTWAGKRLCGAIAGGAEPFRVYADENDPSKSQWYRACAGEASLLYPYGDAYVAGACRDFFSSIDGGRSASPVGAMTGCHGPIGTPNAAIFDLSGNVAEWIDACQTGGADPSLESCLLRGGYFGSDDRDAGPEASFLSCALFDHASLSFPRTRFDDHIGFRCCAP